MSRLKKIGPKQNFGQHFFWLTKILSKKNVWQKKFSEEEKSIDIINISETLETETLGAATLRVKTLQTGKLRADMFKSENLGVETLGVLILGAVS